AASERGDFRPAALPGLAAAIVAVLGPHAEKYRAKITGGGYHSFLLIAFDIRQFHLQYLRVM
ncbi:hypothetical protein, partial [Dickeya undicola]